MSELELEAHLTPRRWTRAEYERLAESGFFGADERLELLDGEIVHMTPQGVPHASILENLTWVLTRALPPDLRMRVQLPMAVDERSLPEPDLAVVPADRTGTESAHPASAALVVAIAVTSLGIDRLRKLPLYAKAGVAEYWIVNVAEREFEVYREPTRIGGRWGYRLTLHLGDGDVVSPLCAPDLGVAVADVLKGLG